jgi:hypothetical protein
MKQPRLFFLSGIVWEFFRFFIFFYLFAIVQLQTMSTNPGSLLWLMLIGSGQLLLPASYFLLFINSKKYCELITILRIAKIIGMFTALVLLIREFFMTNGLVISSAVTESLLNKKYLIFVLLGIFFDLIFLYFLLSYNKGDENLQNRLHEHESDGSLTGGKNLPEFHETIVKNQIKEKDEEL